MKRSRLLRYSIIFASISFFISFPQTAFSQGYLKVVSPLLDTEQANIFAFSPQAEIGLSASSTAGWVASSRFKITSPPDNELNRPLDVTLKEASLKSSFDDTRSARVGRLLLRPVSSLGLNESTTAFLRSELSLDGLQLTSLHSWGQLSFFAGRPQVAGFTWSQQWTGITAALVYRGERNKRNFIPALTYEDQKSDLWRAADTHEAEIAIKTSDKNFQTAGIFQLMQQGAQRFMTNFSFPSGRQNVGDIDTELPRGLVDYRVATQFKSLLTEHDDLAHWIVVAFATKSSVKYYSGSAEERALKQSGGGRSQLTFALESIHPKFTSQIGLSSDFAGSKRFRYFGKENSDASERLVKTKFTAWYSVRTAF